MERCTLYLYWRSSASWRVRWALAIKGVAFDAVGIDLVAGEQTAAAHQARNPIGRVPALVLADGRSLGESVAILEWLDETIPAPALYPEDPWQRARTRQLVEIVNAAMQPLQNISVRGAADADRRGGRRKWSFFGWRRADGGRHFPGAAGLQRASLPRRREPLPARARGGRGRARDGARRGGAARESGRRDAGVRRPRRA